MGGRFGACMEKKRSCVETSVGSGKSPKRLCDEARKKFEESVRESVCFRKLADIIQKSTNPRIRQVINVGEFTKKDFAQLGPIDRNCLVKAYNEPDVLQCSEAFASRSGMAEAAAKVKQRWESCVENLQCDVVSGVKSQDLSLIVGEIQIDNFMGDVYLLIKTLFKADEHQQWLFSIACSELNRTKNEDIRKLETLCTECPALLFLKNADGSTLFHKAAEAGKPEALAALKGMLTKFGKFVKQWQDLPRNCFAEWFKNCNDEQSCVGVYQRIVVPMEYKTICTMLTGCAIQHHYKWCKRGEPYGLHDTKALEWVLSQMEPIQKIISHNHMITLLRADSVNDDEIKALIDFIDSVDT